MDRWLKEHIEKEIFDEFEKDKFGFYIHADNYDMCKELLGLSLYA